MPWKPASPCRWKGCPALSIGPYCDEHQKEADEARRRRLRASDRKRGSSTARGYGKNHRRWRKLILNRDPLCRCNGYYCKHGPGQCFKASTDADHINGDNTDFRMENGQGLCHDCHELKTRHEQGGLGKRRTR